MEFKLEATTKNYLKYVQVGGINKLYIQLINGPTPPQHIVITITEKGEA